MAPDIPAVFPGDKSIAATRTRLEIIKTTSKASFISITSVNNRARYNIITKKHFQS
jgi:hypothetical protein